MNTYHDSDVSSQNHVRKIVVLGGGTAGFLTALALKKTLPDTHVVVVRSTEMGVIGVGEGTIPSVVHFLHQYLDIDRFELYRQVKASPKLGIRFLWGPRPYFNYSFSGQLVTPHRKLRFPRGYYCDDEFDFADIDSALMNHDRVCMQFPNGKPRFNPRVSYHLENKKFVAYIEQLADRFGITKVDAQVTDVIVGQDGVSGLRLNSGETVDGDFFVDCSGFHQTILGEALQEPKLDFSNALLCDRAVVGGWQRTNETYHPFTTAETMQAGWCWRIEHDEIINRGYVFSSPFLSDEQAIDEFCQSNPLVKEPRVIRFSSGVHQRTWVKNVVAIGNAAGFVEPLEATSIGMICDAALRLSKAMFASGGRIVEQQRDVFNRVTLRNWSIVRDFLALHYKFNQRIESPFWQAAINDVPIGEAQPYVEYFRQVGPDFFLLNPDLKRDFFTAEGYLVMLVGQKVGYQSGHSIDETERQAWRDLKKQIASVAAKGLTVPEFLKISRSDVAPEIFGVGKQAQSAVKPGTRVGESVQSGELNWH